MEHDSLPLYTFNSLEPIWNPYASHHRPINRVEEDELSHWSHLVRFWLLCCVLHLSRAEPKSRTEYEFE